MTDEFKEHDVSADFPSEETLRQQLQIQWNDHIQTRNQTWKTLQVELAIYVSVIVADSKLDQPKLLLPFGLFLIFSTVLGIMVTIHHRKVQVKKFKFIYMLESKLGLHEKGYMDGLTQPSDFRWCEVLCLSRMATPSFILFTHIMLLLAAILYIFIRGSGYL